MSDKNNEENFTKAQIIRMFANDQIELDYHLDDQAQKMGISTLTLAKRIAEEEFNIGLNEGTIVKVGRRYELI